jgi:broad specificity phosphatase PhoE
MSIRILRRIQPDNHDALVEHLNSTWASRLQSDVSSYAQGRQRAWLNVQPTFGRDYKLTPTHEDDRLSRFLDSIIPMPWDLALISRGSGIRLHRDASYARPRAFTLNLGGACIYEYENTWRDYSLHSRSSAAPIETHFLGAGDLVEFNCKNRHSATLDADAHKRWAINIWQLR